jgi:aminopeptidase N
MDVKALRSTQFPEDAGSMAHPVRPESYQEINNFYTATIYNKGAEVIRMQHTLLGKDRYRKGMDLYFQRHDGQAVTIDDFVAAMEDANAIDLTQFKRWYSQAGTPTIKVQSNYANGCLSLSMEQSCPPTPECHDKKPFHIPLTIALFDSKGQRMPLASEVIELKEEKQSFSFSGLSEKPVVSLLREFSAPIVLEDGLTEEELMFLLRHETDGYAKWDASQRLVLDCLHDCLKKPLTTDCIPESLIAAFQYVLLDNAMDMDLRAELLMPPGFEEVVATLHNVDVSAIELIRDKFRHQLGLSLYEHALRTYEQLWKMEDHSINGQAYGRRKLRNICLWLMMKANESATMDLCKKQFAAAKTMTDQIAAFSLLVNSSDAASRSQVIESFYKQWSHDELVLDKWFIIQATSEHKDALQQVEQLLKHSAFSIKNPNKVRSLIGAFCQANPRNFHQVDGSGYQFLGAMLITLDQINPQIAARLATPFTRWQRYDESRRKLMLAQLEDLNKLELSRDLQEVVGKSLVVNPA